MRAPDRRARFIAIAAVVGAIACERNKATAVTSATAPDASVSSAEWNAEHLLYAPGMILRQSGSGTSAYKLRSDGCVRVTFRPHGAKAVLSCGLVRHEGENGVAPAKGPICGVRGDELTIEASPETSWALWATDADQ